MPFNQPVRSVFAIHDGILIQAKNCPDLLNFELSPVSDTKSVSYSYFTVTGHPLNDVYTLGIAKYDEFQAAQSLTDTSK